jgi:phage terminase small subunit
MPRGRKPIPDEIKAAKGNPGKRRLMLQSGGTAGSEAAEEISKLKAPAFLASPLEKSIFAAVADELLQRRFVRATELNGLARWCSYMAQWIRAKTELDRKKKSYYDTKSPHVTMLRVHPAFMVMMRLETAMIALEDRYGLNTAARQQILYAMMNKRPVQGELGLGEEPAPAAAAPPAGEAAAGEQAAPASPLGFLRQVH